MRKQLLISIITIISTVGVYYLHKPLLSKKTIVILYAATLSYHTLAHDNFVAVVQKNPKLNIEIRSLSTPDVKDKNSCTATVETALNLGPACIVVVGKVLSQIVSNLAKKRMSSVPIVFIGADTPIELGLVDSLDRPGGTITGTFTKDSSADICGKLLHLALPQIKSVLIPYHSSNDIGKTAEHQALAIKNSLTAHHVNVKVFPIDIMTEAIKRIESVLNEYDLIMTLESDSLSEPYRPGLVKLTNQYRIAFFSGSQAAIHEGALFSYEVNPRFAAEAAFSLVQKIIYEHHHPSTIPVLQLSSSREFIINTTRAAELNITLDLDRILHTINTDPVFTVVRNRVKIC